MSVSASLALEEVDFFVPCFVDQFYPEAAMAAVEVMEALGCVVKVREAATCCGQPAYNAGYWEEARPVAAKWLKDFGPLSEGDQRTIVVLSSSCTGMLRNGYGELWSATAPERSSWQRLRPRILEWVEFVHTHPNRHRLRSVFQHRISYHDACSALRECGIRQQVRDLLAQVQGLELIELTDNETCCGFGGTFAVKYEGISTAMADQKIGHFRNTKADYLVSADLSCLMHLKAYADRQGPAVKTLHLAQVLAAGLSTLDPITTP
jgi:L-lactate dehydrogenase complex protein LldE